MSKVTKVIINYPEGQQPTMVLPSEYQPYRYALGRPGNQTCLIIGMNPSAAREEYSDRTVNKVIKIVQKLKILAILVLIVVQIKIFLLLKIIMKAVILIKVDIVNK